MCGYASAKHPKGVGSGYAGFFDLSLVGDFVGGTWKESSSLEQRSLKENRYAILFPSFEYLYMSDFTTMSFYICQLAIVNIGSVLQSINMLLGGHCDVSIVEKIL